MRSGSIWIAAHAEDIPGPGTPAVSHWWADYEKQHWQDLMQHDKSRRLLAELGWDHEQSVTYHRNRQGFRGTEIPDSTDLVCLGCSFTFGWGLPAEAAWPSVLANNLNLDHVNLAVNGAASDTFFRLARFWLPELKPRYVALLETHGNRREICEYDPSKEKSFLIHRLHTQDDTASGNMDKLWYSNDLNHELTKQRNRAAIQYLCSQIQAQLVVIDVEQHLEWHARDLARDLAHPGVKWHSMMANKFLDEIHAH